MKPTHRALVLLIVFVFAAVAPFQASLSGRPGVENAEMGTRGQGPPTPQETTIDPWPMQRYNETHAGFSPATAPDTSNVQWWSPTGPSTLSSPAIADGKVFIGAGTATGDYMYAFYQNNGTLAWRTRTFAFVSGAYGVTSSPAYANGLVFFGGDRIYALYASNGTIKWNYNTGNGNWGDGSPTVWGTMLFIGGGDRKLYAMDQQTGAVIWTFQTGSGGGNNFGLYSAPAVWGDYVYLAACDLYVYQINVTQPGSTASYYHRYLTSDSMYGSPIVYDGKVIIGNGYHSSPTTTHRLYALDAQDIRNVVWQFYPGRPTSFFSSAAVGYDTLFTGSVEGYLYAVNPRTGGKIWEYAIGKTWSSPAIASNKVFISTGDVYSATGDLYSFNVTQPATPAYNWRYALGGYAVSAPAISDGRLCIGTAGGGGRAYCFGRSTGPADNPPSVSAWEPGGTAGQSYTQGQAVQVRWRATDDNPMPANNVNVSYGSGASWTYIVRNTANTGTFSWDTTGVSPGTYRINVSAYDSMGQSSWDVGNFTFQINPPPNTPPAVTVTQPAGGEVWSGGATVSIVWNMTDAETPQADLMVYINYTYASGGGPIVGPLTGLSPPFTRPWNLPFIDATDIVVTIDVLDASGGRGTDSSPPFAIDSTRPSVLATRPLRGEAGIAVNANIQVDWSEGMNQSATLQAFQVLDNSTWTPVVGQIGWVGNSMIFNPDSDLNGDSWYTANVTTQAKDDSDPGNHLLARYSWSFRTAAIPDNTAPRISDLQAIPSPQEVHLTVNVSALVTDDFGVGVVSAWISGPSGTTNDTMVLDAVSGRYYLANVYHQLGWYSVTVWVSDTSGNWNSSSGSFRIVDTTPPLIQHAPLVSAPTGVDFNVTATVTDNFSLQSVMLNYTDVDGVGRNVSMAPAGQDRYLYEVAAQPHAGTLRYFLWASDTSGNTRRSPTYPTSIVERRPDPPLILSVVPDGYGALRLDWIAPTTNEGGSPLIDLAGFNVYRMTQASGQRVRVNAALVQNATFLDQGLQDGTRYYYVVTAVNSRGVESAESNEAAGTTLAREVAPDLMPFVLAAVVIVVVSTIVAILLLMRRRKRRREPEASEKTLESHERKETK